MTGQRTGFLLAVSSLLLLFNDLGSSLEYRHTHAHASLVVRQKLNYVSMFGKSRRAPSIAEEPNASFFFFLQ